MAKKNDKNNDPFENDIDNELDIDIDLDDMDDDDDDLFGIDPFGDDDDDDDNEQGKDWNLVRALDKVLRNAQSSKLNRHFYNDSADALEYLRERLNMTDIQIVVIAMLIDAGKALSWKLMANYLGLSRLSMMVYTEDVETLVERGWLTPKGAREQGGMFEGFALEYGVVTAIRKNEVFTPAPITGFKLQDFIEHLSAFIERRINDREYGFNNLETWLMKMVNANQQLELCRRVKNLKGSIHDKAAFMLIVDDYAKWGGTDMEGVDMQFIDHVMPEDYKCDFIRRELEEGTHVLFDENLIEHKCMDGMADTTSFMLTQKAKSELLDGYKVRRNEKRRAKRDKSLLDCSKITAKEMFYNDRESEEIAQLGMLLDHEHLAAIQERLEKQGMRKGFACLFYGGPGTGKTESVLQIARQTGRDLMQVDIATLRDKYVGESEKRIKEIFVKYKESCAWAKENNRPMPILFINEADAIISKRSENIDHSVDKMENAMQNIILQQLELLEGILIATTNLTANMDKAFERRFIYKVEFKKPETEVKAKIWKSMLQNLTDEEAMSLAKDFDFSGGQIENIARKSAVDYILTGKHPGIEKLTDFCRAELLDTKKECRHVAGFSA